MTLRRRINMTHVHSCPPVLVPHGDHGLQNAHPGLALHHHVVGEHAAVPADVADPLGQLALLVAEPVAGVMRNVELALGVVGQAVAAGLVVRAAAMHRGVVLGDVEIDRPGPQGRGQLAIGRLELVFVPPVEIGRQNGILRGVVAQEIEQRVGHVGLEAERLGAVDHLQQLQHPLPTVHAAPADLAFGGQPLAVVLGDLAGLAEGLGDPLLIAHRVFVPGLHAARPSRSAPRRWAGCPTAAGARRCGSPCGPASRNFACSSALPIAEPPPVGPQTGATTVPISRFRARALSASWRIWSSLESMSMCGAKRNRSKPSKRTPSNSASAVRSSIVSRSIGGSAPGPLPTTPGQAALWSLG